MPETNSHSLLDPNAPQLDDNGDPIFREGVTDELSAAGESALDESTVSAEGTTDDGTSPEGEAVAEAAAAAIVQAAADEFEYNGQKLTKAQVAAALDELVERRSAPAPTRTDPARTEPKAPLKWADVKPESIDEILQNQRKITARQDAQEERANRSARETNAMSLAESELKSDPRAKGNKQLYAVAMDEAREAISAAVQGGRTPSSSEIRQFVANKVARLASLIPAQAEQTPEQKATERAKIAAASIGRRGGSTPKPGTDKDIDFSKPQQVADHVDRVWAKIRARNR